MIITKTSILSGITRSKDLDITEEELKRWDGGELIQDVFPNLTRDEREFLLTGITDEEWMTLENEEDGDDRAPF